MIDPRSPDWVFVNQNTPNVTFKSEQRLLKGPVSSDFETPLGELTING